MNTAPYPHTDMTKNTTATATSPPHEGSTYGVHTYYNSISTMNTLLDRSSSRYSLYYHNRSHHITTSQDVDVTDNVSVARGITQGKFQSFMSEMAKTKVYLRHIMKHLSFPMDVFPTGNNMENKSGESSDTTGKTP